MPLSNLISAESCSASLFPLGADFSVTDADVPMAQTTTIRVYVKLAEPTLFVQGFESWSVKERLPTLLRGCLIVRFLRTAKVRSINLSLRGYSKTFWPQGSASDSPLEPVDKNEIINHTWPMFQNDDSTLLAHGNSSVFYKPFHHVDDNVDPHTKEPLHDHGWKKQSPTSSFEPGDYYYPFEHPIYHFYPESFESVHGCVNYFLHVSISRFGAFKTDINGRYPLTLVRTPSEQSVEETEPICVKKSWKNLLQYEVNVESKEIILDSFLSLHMHFIPTDKISLVRVRVYLSETLEYRCTIAKKKYKRADSTMRILLSELKGPVDSKLLERGEPVKTKDLGNILLNNETGYLEDKYINFRIYIPSEVTRSNIDIEKKNPNQGLSYKLHPDTNFKSIRALHWLNISMRLIATVNGKKKQYEVTLDTPVHVLHGLCSHANTLLPSYESHFVVNPFSNITENTNEPLPLYASKTNMVNKITVDGELNSSNLGNSDEEDDGDLSNNKYLRAVVNTPVLSPNVYSTSIMHSPPFFSLADRARSDSTCSVNIPEIDLDNTFTDTGHNIYRPDDIRNLLTSPQALPMLSPIGSPFLTPKFVLNEPISDNNSNGNLQPSFPPTYEDTLLEDGISIGRRNSASSYRNSYAGSIPQIKLNRSTEALVSGSIDESITASSTSSNSDMQVSLDSGHKRSSIAGYLGLSFGSDTHKSKTIYDHLSVTDSVSQNSPQHWSTPRRTNSQNQGEKKSGNLFSNSYLAGDKIDPMNLSNNHKLYSISPNDDSVDITSYYDNNLKTGDDFIDAHTGEVIPRTSVIEHNPRRASVEVDAIAEDFRNIMSDH